MIRLQKLQGFPLVKARGIICRRLSVCIFGLQIRSQFKQPRAEFFAPQGRGYMQRGYAVVHGGIDSLNAGVWRQKAQAVELVFSLLHHGPSHRL